MYRSLLSTLALVATVHGIAHDIAVGRGGSLKFDPAEITAAVGDTLVFHFYDTSGPHNVISGDFASPCTPRAGAFFSGDMDGDSQGNAAFIVPITSTDPFYFYCSENRHCQSGMVGAVNPPAGQGAQAYLTSARRASVAQEPGAVGGGTVTSLGSSGGTSSVTGMTSGTSTATTTGTTTTSTTSTTGTTSTTSTTGTTTGTGTTGGAATTASSVASSVRSAAASASSTQANIAGRVSEGVVLGGLAAVLGGFVALMA